MRFITTILCRLEVFRAERVCVCARAYVTSSFHSLSLRGSFSKRDGILLRASHCVIHAPFTQTMFHSNHNRDVFAWYGKGVAQKKYERKKIQRTRTFTGVTQAHRRVGRHRWRTDNVKCVIKVIKLVPTLFSHCVNFSNIFMCARYDSTVAYTCVATIAEYWRFNIFVCVKRGLSVHNISCHRISYSFRFFFSCHPASSAIKFKNWMEKIKKKICNRGGEIRKAVLHSIYQWILWSRAFRASVQWGALFRSPLPNALTKVIFKKMWIETIEWIERVPSKQIFVFFHSHHSHILPAEWVSFAATAK